jgi:DNA repair exonuclease SbcCD ATPase subunit
MCHYQRFDSSNGHIYSNNGQTFQVYQFINQIFQSTDALMSTIVGLLPFLKIQGITDLTKSVNTYRGKINEVEQTLADVRKTSKEISDYQETSENLAITIRGIASSVEKHRQQVETDSPNVALKLKESEENSESITEILEAAKALEKQVQKYKTDFESFDTNLETRNSQLEELLTNLENAKAANTEREEQVQTLLGESETLLKGATVTGLASSFHETYAVFLTLQENPSQNSAKADEDEDKRQTALLKKISSEVKDILGRLPFGKS